LEQSGAPPKFTLSFPPWLESPGVAMIIRVEANK